MKIYFYGFWGNFITRKTNNKYFIELLEKVFNEKIEVSSSLEESDILFESVFSKDTKLYEKNWKYTILFSGESDRRVWNSIIRGSNRINTLKDYSCILKGEKNNNNIINLPLFVYYNYCFNIDNLFDNIPKPITIVPEKNICVIVTNGHDSEGRNYFFEKLERIIPIDYAGEYKNNIPRINCEPCSPEFINFVSQYKFIITMENSKNETYITEKILHGFTANIIPVYWGSDYITEYFNEERFINVKDFNEETIYNTIKKMIEILNDNNKFLEIVNKPIYKNNVIPFKIENIANEIKELIF
jgi:hypothetical protein